MSSKNILYYGTDEPLPERIPLRAGPLALFYEQGDLRYIKLGDQEILRRIYVAIRDRNWGTILPRFSNIRMDIQADSFYITYEVENKRGEIDFAWKGEITGDAQGKIIFSMRGAGTCHLHAQPDRLLRPAPGSLCRSRSARRARGRANRERRFSRADLRRPARRSLCRAALAGSSGFTGGVGRSELFR